MEKSSTLQFWSRSWFISGSVQPRRAIESHLDTHMHTRTHTHASLPFNKIQTVPSLFMTGLVKPQRNRIPSNYNVREPLPRPQTGLSLAVPEKLPHRIHPHSASVLQTDCSTHLCYFTTERTKTFVRPVIPVLCSTLCGGGGLVL